MRRQLPIRAGYSADGRFIVCGSDDGQLVVWDAEAAGGRSSAAAPRGRLKVAACERFQARPGMRANLHFS